MSAMNKILCKIVKHVIYFSYYLERQVLLLSIYIQGHEKSEILIKIKFKSSVTKETTFKANQN